MLKVVSNYYIVEFVDSEWSSKVNWCGINKIFVLLLTVEGRRIESLISPIT